MSKINWGRVFLCGLLASVVAFVLWLPAIALVGGDFVAAVKAAGGQLAISRVGSIVFFTILNLVGGIFTMWLYAAIRPRYGPGPKTAALAGFAVCFICGLTDVFWGSLGLIRPTALVVPAAVALPIFVVAAVVGAWPYKE